MNHDTPLAEVAHLLPTQVAEFLLSQEERCHTMVLTGVRSLVTHIEEQNVHLDSFQLEAVLGAFVPVMTGHVTQGMKLASVIGQINSLTNSVMGR